MAKKQVAGIPLATFQGPIREALSAYADQSVDAVVFDLDGAVKLELTPDKPNSARSATPVEHLGRIAGELFVIVFAPGDGTGDENTFALSKLRTGKYPRQPKVVPRSKAAADSEIHLTIASFNLDAPNADPAMFAGNQALLGLRDNAITQIGILGQSTPFFQLAVNGERQASPAATLTVGLGVDGERFGDPHAVYNAHPEAVQVCGFLALSPEAAQQHRDMLWRLRAYEPLPAS